MLFNKRAFAVSGKFHQMLTDLKKTKHNSNQILHQITLNGEILTEYVYYLLGFVPANVLNLKTEPFFTKLDYEHIKSVEKYLDKNVF